MTYFVKPNSIVREIWGKADTVLFIFAAASAEFALNKAVDWLYFTGRLPADPLGRLFSTVDYARHIIFSDEEEANKAIDQITAIHKHVEDARGEQIPGWAYRSVLFMLIDCSIRSFEVLERQLTTAEKEEVFDVFYRVGIRMQIEGLPKSYSGWLTMRAKQLTEDLIGSPFTLDLYKQYEKHLGTTRYFILKQVQLLVTPKEVGALLPVNSNSMMPPALWIYKVLRKRRIGKIIKQALLPAAYKERIMALDTVITNKN